MSVLYASNDVIFLPKTHLPIAGLFHSSPYPKDEIANGTLACEFLCASSRSHPLRLRKSCWYWPIPYIFSSLS